MIITPRDWQAIAMMDAIELLGSPEATAKIAESKRYGLLADELERLQLALNGAGRAIEDYKRLINELRI